MVHEVSKKGQWSQRLVRLMLERELGHRKDESHQGPITGVPRSGFMAPAPISGDLPTYEGFTWDKLPADPLFAEEEEEEEEASAAPRAFRALSLGEEQPSQPQKICIIGAGVAGLYIAMILDDLKIPNLTYEILEANTRVGGRIYTHYFDRNNPHDYCDIGAMRFPDIPIMERTFTLFREILKVPLIPYYLEGKNCPKLFNDKLYKEDVSDPYGVGRANGGLVPEQNVDNIDTILDDAFGPWKQKLKANFNKGFEELMTVDDMSTREYLKRGGPNGEEDQKYDFFTIQWAETQNTSSNLFDQAFSESVMDSFDFDYQSDEEEGAEPKKVDWYCVDGGTTLVTEAMEKSITQKIETGRRVEAIGQEGSGTDNMFVKVVGEEKARTGYTTVFNTTSLGCLARMETQSLGLIPSVKDAIRCLHYDDSAKLALKFSYPWWIKDCGITEGGVASTDLPLRTCVYPSYNLHDGDDKPAVLLASYTWAQDANRIGSLVGQEEKEKELIEVVLRDLAKLHSRPGDNENKGITYEEIKKAFTGEYNVFSWSQDPFTSGAFALFGPSQFSRLYPLFSLPAAGGKFHIVGEASSVHHAWVVGSLDSAVAAVHKFLRLYGLKKELLELKRKWKDPEEIESGQYGTVHLQTFFDAIANGSFDQV